MTALELAGVILRPEDDGATGVTRAAFEVCRAEAAMEDRALLLDLLRSIPRDGDGGRWKIIDFPDEVVPVLFPVGGRRWPAPPGGARRRRPG